MTNQQRDICQLYCSFLNSFDGSSSAFANAEPIMDELFHPHFHFVTDDRPKDLDWYRNFAKSFAQYGNMAKVLSIERHDNDIEVTIENVVDGVQMDPITYHGVLTRSGKSEDEKIIYFAPVQSDAGSRNEEGVAELIQRVDECKKSSSSYSIRDEFSMPHSDEDDNTDIYFVCKHEIHNLERFQDHALAAIVKMKEAEPDQLAFNMYFAQDEQSGKVTCNLVEHYRNSKAAEDHIENMRQNADRNAAINDCANISCLEMYGPASSKLEALLLEEEYDTVFYGPRKIGL